ncbi:MAG: DUF1501 domain-containing protein [Herpetosiphon sp.]
MIDQKQPAAATLTRRDLFRQGLAAGAAVLGSTVMATQPAAAARSSGKDLLLYVFLRGAADGLNMVVPHGDNDYYRARSTIAIDQPGKGMASALDLDGFFGFHPALSSFKRLYDARLLAPVHACGSPDPTHSHFDGMDYMERGVPGDKRVATGWLGRHLQLTAGSNDSVLRAVGMGGHLQSSLRGSTNPVAISSIASFHLGRPGDNRVLEAALRELYGGDGMLEGVASQTFSVLEQIDRRIKPDYQPAHGAQYPKSGFGRSLRDIAQLAKSDQGLEVACADVGGWDTHANQGGHEGNMSRLLADLGGTLEAFVTDLEDRIGQLTIIVMSEFGRRVKENASAGTDHGHGNCAFVLGGGIRGGHVYGQWPGLHPEQLYASGDLQVTTDFRDILSEVVQYRLGNSAIDQIFPGYTPRPLDLTSHA